MNAEGDADRFVDSAPSARGSRDPIWVELGRVARSYRDGSLGVGLYGDDPGTVLAASEVLLEGRTASIQFRIADAESLAFSGDRQARVRIWLQGIADRESAEIHQ